MGATGRVTKLPSTATVKVPHAEAAPGPNAGRAMRVIRIERGFLGIGIPVPIVSMGSAQMKTGTRQRGETVGADSDRKFGITQAQGERVVGALAVALTADLGADRLGLAEEDQGLIGEMRPQVQQNASALGRDRRGLSTT